MPELSNSYSSSNRILISEISTTFTGYYPNNSPVNAPVVELKFNLTPLPGISNFSGQVNISSMSYVLIPISNGTYREPNSGDTWTSFTREEIDSMVANRTLSIYWDNRGDRNYLRVNTAQSGIPVPVLNYITFKIKNLPQFSDIEEKQMYVKIMFEEGGDTAFSGENTIYDENGNNEIIFKTTNQNGDDIGIKTTNPDIGSIAEEKRYTNNSGFYIKISGYTGDAEYYAYSINGGALSSWSAMPDAVNNVKEISINLGSDVPDGEYVVSIVARDRYFNYSGISSDDAITFMISKVSTAPFDCEFNIYGQDGNSRYAGVTVNPDKSFTPNREVSVVFFGNSELPMYCRIYSNDNEVLVPKVVTDVSGEELTKTVYDIPSELKQLTELDSSNSNCDTGTFLYKNTFVSDKNRVINELTCILVGSDYNTSSDRSLTVVFTDIAGNETTITKTIKFNNRIFKCAKKNLREEGSDYSHIVMKENTYGSFDTIPEVASGLSNAYKRMWGEVYFPSTHSPKMKGNNIDIDWARSAYAQYINAGNKFTYNESDNYGIFEMTLDGEGVYQPAYDSDGRIVSIWNSSKKYSSYISRNKSDMWFHVIDNTGYGDITIEFERFDMASSPGDMANATAGGYKGDVVMIYNADNKNCLTEVKNSDGSVSYPTDGVNTVLMELLAVYSGSPGSVYDWFSGEAVKSNDTTGAFSATFQCQRICIIVCTDSSKERSGFKIKAGKKIGLTYSNYDVDETNGELWYHGESDDWGSTNNKIRMFYDYYDSSVSFDYDKGFVVMNINDIPDGAVVSCDYSYYKNKDDYNDEDNAWLNGDADGSGDSAGSHRTYLLSDDDLYEYITPFAYVTPYNKKIDKTGALYYPDTTISGKFTDSYWSIDKDRGVLQINKYTDSVPDKYVPFNENGYPMRITMDYTHHTFYRLSNDGYGNVKFEDKVIVADSTPVYPDATWADIRIINEGDAILESGKLIFKCRGEAEGESEEVRKPLDVNRPWDVQEGKKAVTWDRCRVYLSYTYNENYFQFTPTISNLRKTYNDAGGNNAALSISSSEPYLPPKEAIYGRIVWNLAGDTGQNLNNVRYPTDGLTVGRKSWSAEISGRYYVVED